VRPRLQKNFAGVTALTFVSRKVRYMSITVLTALASSSRDLNLEGAIAVTKFVIAVLATLSIFASPVLAAPHNDVPPTSYNGDFQLQGR
jgi:hypothetical protein